MKKSSIYRLFLVIITATLAIFLVNVFYVTDTYQVDVDWPQKHRVMQAVEKHLTTADGKASAAIKKNAKVFRVFVDSKKSGAKPFAEDIYSLEGKWHALKSYLPFIKNESHKKFISEKFSQYFFSNEQLATVLNQSVMSAIKDFDAIENELAVNIHREILGEKQAFDEYSVATKQFNLAVQGILHAARQDALKGASQLVASEIGASIGERILVRMLVSTGILSAGAVNSSWSFGTALFIGFIADYIWELIDEPEKDIEREVFAAMTAIAINGGEAIEQELVQAFKNRRQAWVMVIDRSINDKLGE